MRPWASTSTRDGIARWKVAGPDSSPPKIRIVSSVHRSTVGAPTLVTIATPAESATVVSTVVDSPHAVPAAAIRTEAPRPILPDIMG